MACAMSCGAGWAGLLRRRGKSQSRLLGGVTTGLIIVSAVVCKATLPAKPQHALDLYIEAMEVLSKEQIHPLRETLVKLRSVAAAAKTETEPSVEQAFQQRKCRRLLRYPTQDC